MQENSFNDSENEKFKELTTPESLLQIRIELFKAGNFDFITKGIAKNHAGDWGIGETTTHEKQKTALELLTDKTTHHFLYGGAAGGSKTWTGVAWMVFSCLAHPHIKCFIARNELGSLLDSVYQTFKKVCRAYGVTNDLFVFNAQKNFIQFKNGSHINLIEVKYKPSDPMYEDVGSTEYTLGWLEEVGEIHHQAYLKLSTRIGRHYNSETGLVKKLYMTCNPKQNWAKTEFYDKHQTGVLYEENKLLLDNGELPSQKVYLNCLVVENPFIDQDNINELMSKAREDVATYERLFKGNWDYEDNKDQLCNQEMIEEIFRNDHVVQGKTYITADVARLGQDKTVIGVWRGWRLIEIHTIKQSALTEVQSLIDNLRRKFLIPKNRCIADEDGLGGGVVDNCGILGFKNNETPIKEKGVFRDKKDMPAYRNRQIQCLYHLSNVVNEGAIWINADIDKEQKRFIKQELAQIIRRTSDYGKLEVKPKSEIKKDIGRSPDYRDMLLMRVVFDLKRNNTVDLVTNWS